MASSDVTSYLPTEEEWEEELQLAERGHEEIGYEDLVEMFEQN